MLQGCGYEYSPSRGDPEYPVAPGTMFQVSLHVQCSAFVTESPLCHPVRLCSACTTAPAQLDIAYPCPRSFFIATQ